jgi:dienelactone hydrolase
LAKPTALYDLRPQELRIVSAQVRFRGTGVRIIKTASLCLALLGYAAPAFAKPPAEAFGEPTVQYATMSPDGKKVASVWSAKDGEVIVVTDIETGKSRALANVTTVKPRDLDFVSNDYVVAQVSQTRRVGTNGEKFQHSTAFAFNLKDGKFVELQRSTQGLAKQSGLGRILGVSADGNFAYMPAFVSRDNRDPTYALFRVNLATGASGVVKDGWGSSATEDWIAAPNGDAQYREEFHEVSGKHDLLQMIGSEWTSILSEKTGERSVTLEGVRAGDRAGLVSSYSETGVLSLFTIDDAGAMTPVLAREDADIEGLVMDSSRVISGVRYAGMTPQYGMFDPALNTAIRKVQKALGGSATYLIDWSNDWSKMMFFSEGGAASGEYFIFDKATGSLQSLLGVRPAIPDDAVAQVEQFEYAARDGLKIPALITWPIGVAPDARKNLPLIVLPHGGPASYDTLEFNGLAQFLANEGYAVLQPNFRGSTGFGLKFKQAGYGEWGRKMQDDVSDGVAAMTASGAVNAKRVCIVGWSYGGYSALAGGALSPELYACIVSVAGVSNLRDMLAWEYDRIGPNNPTYRYWTRLIGNPDTDGAAIDAVSPGLHADRFKAPVLLIHGNDDTTVPPSQSSTMADALNRAGKKVTFQRIVGDDHNLDRDQNSMKVYESIAAFVAANMPPG